MRTFDRRTILAILLPPLIIAAVGATHPPNLTQEASLYWRNLHIVLLPLFPLLAVGPWLVARSIEPVYGRLTLVLGYVFACFYSALDILAGIAAGGLKYEREGGLGVVFDLARELGQVGSIAFIGATAAAAGCILRVAGPWALPGALIAIAGAYGFMEEHVYPPGGVISMLAIAAGWTLMLVAVSRRRTGAYSPLP